MSAADREILQRLAAVNQHLGYVDVELLEHQDDSGVRPDALRVLAGKLHRVVTDLHALADGRSRGAVITTG